MARKKEELIKKTNSKVIISNTVEAKILSDLTINADIIYRYLNKHSSYKIDIKDYTRYKSEFIEIVQSLDNYFLKIAKEIGVTNIKKSKILEEIKAREMKNGNK